MSALLFLVLHLFTLPTVPEALEAPADRALYLAQHYWDNTPLSDTLVNAYPDEFEAFLVDYLTIVPMLDDDQQTAALKPLFAVATPLLRRYLTEAGSPVANAELYQHALRGLVGGMRHVEAHMRYKPHCPACAETMEELDHSDIIRRCIEEQQLTLRVHSTSDEPRILLFAPSGQCLSDNISVQELETILQEIEP